MPVYLTGFTDVPTKWKASLHATTHDASTIGGNSGSAVLDLTTGSVLALHFGGVYLKANYGVPTWELAQDKRVVDIGVNFAEHPDGASGRDGAGVADVSNSLIWISAWDSVKPLRPVETPASVEVATQGREAKASTSDSTMEKLRRRAPPGRSEKPSSCSLNANSTGDK